MNDVSTARRMRPQDGLDGKNIFGIMFLTPVNHRLQAAAFTILFTTKSKVYLLRRSED